jgi:membrane-associated phospholipid phosphatase
VAFVVLGLAWRHLERTPRILALTAAVGVTLLVAADRLVVGAHWLTDVVGSLSLAAVVVAVVLGAQHLLLSSER